MSAVRTPVIDGGLTRMGRAGDNPLTTFLPAIIATDTNQTLAAASIAGGLVQFSSFTAGRQVTTDTAANILALCPWMDIGDSFIIGVSCVAAFAATWVAGSGVTLAGKATTPASGFTWVLITKTAASTVTWNVL